MAIISCRIQAENIANQRFKLTRNLDGLNSFITLGGSQYFRIQLMANIGASDTGTTLKLWAYDANNQRVSIGTKSVTLDTSTSYTKSNYINLREELYYYYSTCKNGLEVEVVGGIGVTNVAYFELQPSTNFNIPVISNLAISQLNVDLAQKFTWDSSGTAWGWQNKYILTTGSYTYTGGEEKEHTVTRRLDVGYQTATITPYYVPVQGIQELKVDGAPVSITFTTTQIIPTITTLEPSGVNQNRETDIPVTWTSTNQDTFTLQARQNGVEVAKYTGTTQQTITIPKDTLQGANTYLTLTVAYRNGQTATKEVVFLAYGKPQQPTLDSTTIYNTSKPTFTWNTNTNPSDTPISWELQLLNGSTPVESTGEVLGNTKTYTVANALTNNTTYSLKVRVKNQFNLWSEWATKSIQIQVTELPKPTFDVIYQGNSVVLNIKNSASAYFKTSEVWRKDRFTGWTRIAYNLGRNTTYTDNTLQHGKEYTYKITSISTQGAVTESDTKTASIEIDGYMLTNVEDFTSSWVQYLQVGQSNVSIDGGIKRGVDTSIYAGNKAPTIETDGTSYRQYTMQYDVNLPDYEDFIYMLYNCKLFLYRDEKGRKLYGMITSDITEKDIEFDGKQIRFTFTEVSFLEQDMYKGDGGVVLVYLDGKYKLDGSLLLTGERVL